MYSAVIEAPSPEAARAAARNDWEEGEVNLGAPGELWQFKDNEFHSIEAVAVEPL